MSKNKEDINSNNSVKELILKQLDEHYKKLRALRNLLLLTTAELESATKISASSIKRVENGKNIGNDILGQLIFFYGYSFEEFFALKALPTWQELIKRMETFHKKNGSESYKVIYTIKPTIKDLLQYRAINSTLFDNWVSSKEVVIFCEKHYGFKTINSKDKDGKEKKPTTINALNALVKLDLLIKQGKTSDVTYMRKK